MGLFLNDNNCTVCGISLALTSSIWLFVKLSPWSLPKCFKFSTLVIRLSFSARYYKFFKQSRFYIFLILLCCKYNTVNLSNTYKFYILLIFSHYRWIDFSSRTIEIFYYCERAFVMLSSNEVYAIRFMLIWYYLSRRSLLYFLESGIFYY